MLEAKKDKDDDGMLLDRPRFNMDPNTLHKERLQMKTYLKYSIKGAKEKRNY